MGLSERDEVDTGEPEDALESEDATDGGRGGARVGFLGGVTRDSCDVDGIVRSAGTARSARARGWRSAVQKGPPVEEAEDDAEDDVEGCGSSAAQAVRVDAEETVRASEAAVGAW